MAKQTLDMYKLFKLVVSKGGLVEVINKKLWREITKGLSLPSSITSAAFTLRTQYMKYLYTYECEKYSFSSPTELQSAIDGNRREGRRPGYGYDMPSPSMPPFYGQQGFPNGNPFFNPLVNSPMASLISSQLQGAYMNGCSMPGGPPVNHPRLAAPVTVSSSSSVQIGERSQSPINVSSPHASTLSNRRSPLRRSHSPEMAQSGADIHTSKRARLDHSSLLAQLPPTQTLLNSSHSESVDTPHSRLEQCPTTSSPMRAPSSPPTEEQPHISTSNPHLQISNENGVMTEINMDSVTVCMEVNGVTYKGTLYAKKDH